MTSGQLQLRGADPFDLEAPTTISGTNTDGALSGVQLSTPTVTTVRDVPDYSTTATITAAFSMVQPGTGSINEDGSMTVRVRLAVDLHIVVPLLPIPSDCRAAPVDLTLSSTAPYDGEQVTLRAPGFSIPAVDSSTTCNGLIASPVNDALAGSGHILALTLAGAITPPVPGEPTSTSLVATPAGRSRVGQDVTLVATVAPTPEVPGAPAITGVVTFLDGAVSVGTAEVAEDGTATLVTAGLPAGLRELRAVYGGAPPDWDPSTSDPLAYAVTADPALVTTATGEVVVDGPATDFDVTVVNTGFGADLDGARLQVVLRRQAGTAPVGPNGTTPRLVLSSVDGAEATPVTLIAAGTGGNQTLSGTIGAPGAWDLPPGTEATARLRLQVAADTAVGPLSVIFTLVADEDGGPVALATTTGVVTMVTEARQATTVVAGSAGFPPVIPPIPPITPVVRQGNVAELRAVNVTPTVSPGVFSTGTYTFAVDGVPVRGQGIMLSLPDPYTWLDAVPKSAGGGTYLIQIPPTTPIGTRQVTVRYSGDGLYAPSQANFPITVEPAVGTVYECGGVGFAGQLTRFTANVEVQATLPAVWPAGQDLPVSRFQVQMRLSRTDMQKDTLIDIVAPGAEPVLRIDLGPEGIVTPAAVTSANSTPFGVGDVNPPDRLVGLTGGTGVLAPGATPGEATTYTVDRIEVSTVNSGGFSSGFVCTPVVAPYVVGTVVAAGTSLAVDRVGPVGVGSDVSLTATALPVAPGVVEFRDGATTIGVVPVNGDGVATMVTSALPVGTRSLSARFFGGVVATSPSPVVELRVVGECPGFLDAGNGAVVRLVYLELLGRCPDAAGYAFWTGRLDGGTSPEAFARSIARTSEAVGRVVDDAYRTMLGRPADASGRVFWTERLLGHGRYDQLLADLAGSSEFWSLAGSTDAGFVTRVYDRLLGRAPEVEGLDYWTGRLAAGASPRALVLSLANLDEPLGVLVRGSYGAILDRAPDAGERTAGIGHLRSTGDRSGLYAQLIGRPEFGDRAQAFPG